MKNRKKNIVILRSSNVLAGAEFFILDLASQFQNDKDIDCTILCLWKNPKYPIPLFEEAKIRGLKVERIDVWGRFNLWTIPSVLRFLYKNKIDFIHTTGYKADIVGLIAAKLARLPVMCHIQGFVERYYRTRAYNLLTFFFARYFDRVIPCSDSLSKIVSTSGVRRDKLVTIHNCVSLERCSVKTEEVVRVKKELGVANSDQIVVTLARLDPEKGQIYLLQAAREVLSKLKNVKFVIIGDGRLREELESSAQKMGIEKQIIFTGYRSDAQAILSLATVVTFPSLNEGLPHAMLEGMAHGKPIVATTVQGMPEVLTDGVNGYLVPSEDYLALADALEKLLSNNELSESMGKRALQTLKEEHTMEVMAEKIKRIYDQLWTERGRNKI